MHTSKRLIIPSLLGIVTVITLNIAGCQSPDTALARTVALVNEKKYPEAIEQGKQATAQDPSDYWAWYWLGAAYHGNGQCDEAIAAFHRVTDLNCGTLMLEASYYRLGSIYRQRKHYDQAILYLKKAVAVKEPPDPVTLNELGLAYLESGQLQPAIEAFERAIELKSDDSVLRANLQRALNADMAAQAELFTKASLSGLLTSSDASVTHARERNRALIAAKNLQLPAILRDSKTDQLSALVVKIEQTILDLNHECEVAKDRAQQATATNGDPRQIDELRGLAISYRERIELLKPILTALKEEIANRGR